MANVERATRATRELADEAAKTAAIVKAEFGKIGRSAAELAGEFQILSEEMGAVSRAAGETTGAEDVLKGATGDLDRATAALAGVAGRAADGLRGEGAASAETAALIAALEGRVNDLSDALARSTAMAAADRAAIESVGRASLGAAAATRAAGAGATRAGVGFRAFGFGLRLTGTVLHWIVAGTAEFLAVAIPAVVALAAGMAVAAQGAQNAYNHITALYTATEATANVFHKTTGDVLGLGHSLQAAQDAANPGVYEILGSAINDAKVRFSDFAGAGLQVVHMLDEFSARITVDLKGSMGGQLHALLDGMVTDLRQFGQVLGNLGHALLNVAADMPGLARVLLALLAGFTGLLRILTSLPGPLLTVAMGLEEVFRWGGLVLGPLVRLTRQTEYYNALLPKGAGFILKFGTALSTLARSGGLALMWGGQMIGRLAGLGTAFGSAGTRLASLGTSIASITPEMANWATVTVAATIAVMVVLDHYRNESQRFVDSTNQAIAAASTNVAALRAMAAGITQTTAQIAAQQRILAGYAPVARGVGEAVGGMVTWLQRVAPPLGGAAQGLINATNSSNMFARGAVAVGSALSGPVAVGLTLFLHGSAQAASQLDQLTAAQQKWAAQAHTVISGAQALAGVFHTSLPAAMSLADMAGVNLRNSIAQSGFQMQIAVQQIRNLITGLGAMGAPAGVVGTDMTAIGIQSQLAATKITQLNQALDAWVHSITGGTSAMGSLVLSIHNIGQVTQSTAGKLGQLQGSMTLSVNGIARALKGFGQTGAQVWQNFDQALSGSSQQLMDWFRTAGTMGVASSGQLHQAVLDLASGFVKMASKSATARAELVSWAHANGASATTWKGLLAEIASGHAKFSGLGKIVGDVTKGMSNMSKVAQNLSAVVGQQLNVSLAAAINQNSGLNAALQQYAKDLSSAHTPASVLAADTQRIHDAMAKATRMTTESAKTVTTAGKNTGALFGSSAAKGIAGAQPEVGTAVRTLFQQHKEGDWTGGATKKGGSFYNTGFEVGKSVASGIKGAGSLVSTQVRELYRGTSQVGAALAPGALLHTGQQVITGFLRGMGTSWPQVWNWIKAIPGKLESNFAGSSRALFNDGLQLLSGLLAGATSHWPAVSNWFKGLPGKIRSAVPAAAHILWSVGVSIVDGLVGGIQSRSGHLLSAVGNLISSIPSKAMSLLGIHSPSRVTWLIGQNTVQGLINGLTQGIPQIQKAIGELVATVREAFRKGVISMGRESDLVAWVRSDNTKLQGLAKQRSAIANEIKQVNATTAALQTSFGSIIHPFSGTGPTPLTAKQLAAIPTAQQDVAGLQSQLSVMKKFASDLTRLKKLGLAPGLIAKIIAMGPVQGSAYAEALIAAAGQGAGGAPNPGGPAGGPMLPGGVNPGGKLGGVPTNAGGGATGIIAQLNSAWNQINAMSKSLANQVSGSLYGAGQQGAAGLIAGLKSQMKHIDAMMKHIADVLVRRLKKDLKIKSPSEVMRGHGLAVDEGLAKGIYDGAPVVDAAMKHLSGVVAGGLPKWVNPGGGARGGDGVTGINPGGLMKLVGSLTSPGGPLGAGGVRFGGASPEPFRGPGAGASPGGLWVPPPAHGGGVNPGGPASLTVHVHVHGNVMTSQELGAEVRKEILRYSRRNWSNGLAPHGKVS